MSEPERLAAAQKADLLARERAHARALIDAYGEAYQRICARLSGLTGRIADLRRTGMPITHARLVQEARYQAMLLQVAGELIRFAQSAGDAITTQQRTAVQQAAQDAAGLVRASLPNSSQAAAVMGSFQTLPSPAMQQMVGMLGDGRPLATLLSEIAPQAVQVVKATLTTGLVAGDTPRKIATQLRDDLGIGLTRALAISRTSVMTAYRGAALDIYRQNDDVVQEWRWSASLSSRTCAMCLAMNGRTFPLDTPFGSHTNCRCCPTPVTLSWEDLGIDLPDTRPPTLTGEEWFAAQPADVQKSVLGPAKFEAFRQGRFSLSDLVGYRDDPKWGPTRWERSLKDVQGAQPGKPGAAGIGSSAGSSSAAAGSGGSPPTAPSGSGGGGENGGGTPSAGDKLPSNPEWEAKVRAARDSELRGYAMQRGMSVDDYEAAVNAHMAVLMQSLSPAMRIPPEKLERVLQSGEFKNQFQTGTSQGLLNPDRRRRTEKSLFGIDDAATGEQRPVYGYLHRPNKSQLTSYNEYLDNYSENISVRFKQDVLRHITFTVGDTLDETNAGQTPAVAPQPVAAPSWVAASAKAGDMLNYRTAKALLEATADLYNGIGYVEAQLHGGVTLADVQEVLFYENPPTANLARLLKDNKVRWRVVQ